MSIYSLYFSCVIPHSHCCFYFKTTIICKWWQVCTPADNWGTSPHITYTVNIHFSMLTWAKVWEGRSGSGTGVVILDLATTKGSFWSETFPTDISALCTAECNPVLLLLLSMLLALLFILPSVLFADPTFRPAFLLIPKRGWEWQFSNAKHELSEWWTSRDILVFDSISLKH